MISRVIRRMPSNSILLFESAAGLRGGYHFVTRPHLHLQSAIVPHNNSRLLCRCTSDIIRVIK